MENKEIYITNLQFYIESIDELTELIRNNRPLSVDLKQKAQQMLTEFKANLNNSLKDADKYGKNASVVDYDFNNYSSAIRDVSANMTIRTNSNPENWILELNDARFSLTYGLGFIKKEK
ncbi:hypothetical protein P8917_09700 [Bacillus atrophaeus]|uniref:hypothetical protein n=1 Tax=Bacillus atrophaeus TaxID=1452 RepID=UPI00228100F2|nr:hypothetical protein [Bacillus atrophaeus]MCY8814524.1 hypothetical protein [Bacillus atrophaeus]MCY8823244.1 hypothetical protein [Bacillus atrophaeus]MCY8831210.1 hypothetical protein [Bacillus atrophaeus]MCY8834991.1 hypothetical protein [Bacillus atrophaeus]MEC0748241.1 hypothetical protein [Bacillus atrophaeus]